MIKVHIGQDFNTDGYSVFIYEDIMNNDEEMNIANKIDKDGRIVFKKVSRHSLDVKPLFKISGMKARGFFPEFQKAISNMGIKLPEENQTIGELKSTKEHLADMRKLVFEKSG